MLIDGAPVPDVGVAPLPNERSDDRLARPDLLPEFAQDRGARVLARLDPAARGDPETAIGYARGVRFEEQQAVVRVEQESARRASRGAIRTIRG